MDVTRLPQNAEHQPKLASGLFNDIFTTNSYSFIALATAKETTTDVISIALQ